MIIDRFCAELFRLSSDRTQWNILYPSLLSVMVVEIPSRKQDANCKAIRLLVKNESKIIDEQILDASSRITRVSSCFAYWHYRSRIYGINVISADDCDRFYRLIRGSCEASNCTLRDLTPTSSTSSSVQTMVIPAYIMQIFNVDKGVVENHDGSFTECIIKLAENGALIRSKNKEFSLNLLESIMVVGEIKERLYISEPTGAFAIECSNSRNLRFLLIKLLTTASFLQSATTSISNTISYLHNEISKVNQSINSLLRSLGSLQSECELAQDLDDELEMNHLQLFTLKYRLAAISDINFPTPSELLSKISLRTLRHLSSFGGAAICSLHLHFLCKSQFQIAKRLWNHREELMLNVSRLRTLSRGKHSSGAVSVSLPSGSIINLKQTNADSISEILHKVCKELKLDPGKHYVVREGSDRVRLQERDYQLQKRERCFGLTISAKMCDSGGVVAEVRAVCDKTACVEVGDLVISVDNRPVSSLRSAEEVEILLRYGTTLVLRKRDAITSQHVKPGAPLSTTTSNTTSATVATTFDGPALPPPPPPQSSVGSRSRSMDRISNTASYTGGAQRDQQNASTRSSPTRSVHTNDRPLSIGHSLRQMSRSTYEKLPQKREDNRYTTPSGAIPLSHFSEGAEEQLLKTINELVSTEENFVRDIQKLVNQYLKPTNLPLLEAADRLLRIQTSFYLSLLDAAGDVARFSAISQQQLRDSLIRLSALFVNKCSKFKIYSDYSAAYLRFQQKKSELNDIAMRLEKLNISGEQSESAQSLLIKPIQRVLKYPLFLRQIKDNCLQGSVERQQGEQALTRMQALAEYVNEMQRLTEQYGQTIDEISSKNGAASRMNFSQLLMFAHITWLNCPENRSRPIACVAFVFTSLILIFCPTLSKNKGKVYRVLPIVEVDVNESSGQSSQSQHAFILTHIGSPREPVYHLCCCQAEIKNHFIKSIRKAAASIAKEQRRPISGSSQSDGGYSSERHVL
ncbi:unnamed protein product [Litomosoides sigmodontis]|uniref:DH domain-containing protein n=1 Tax=Litomosoides sigmodontis TaxID=42156 RepID=A0A3P6TXP9_LITSI|nr:unnamed protein product [Litomosoides sigmodontis]